MGSTHPGISGCGADTYRDLEDMAMAIIELENLKYRYPNTGHLALDGISLSVEKGEFIGIIGANGAGKSTLCQAIIGLVPQFYKGA